MTVPARRCKRASGCPGEFAQFALRSKPFLVCRRHVMRVMKMRDEGRSVDEGPMTPKFR